MHRRGRSETSQRLPALDRQLIAIQGIGIWWIHTFDGTASLDFLVQKSFQTVHLGCVCSDFLSHMTRYHDHRFVISEDDITGVNRHSAA